MQKDFCRNLLNFFKEEILRDEKQMRGNRTKKIVATNTI
jgi:hypothetical protein